MADAGGAAGDPAELRRGAATLARFAPDAPSTEVTADTVLGLGVTRLPGRRGAGDLDRVQFGGGPSRSKKQVAMIRDSNTNSEPFHGRRQYEYSQ
jgi:hypothetical protein